MLPCEGDICQGTFVIFLAEDSRHMLMPYNGELVAILYNDDVRVTARGLIGYDDRIKLDFFQRRFIIDLAELKPA
jgi:hypothetical protein